MPLRYSKRLLVLVLTAGAIAVLIAVAMNFGGFSDAGRGRLPVGKGTPAIALGERHGLILASDGSLWTWGSDFFGWPVLGLGSNTLKSTRLKRIGNGTNWVNISAGQAHDLAVKSDGTLWTWGESVPFTKQPIYSPILAALGNDWKQAAAGGIVSIALKTNGTLWAWGNNWAGSVGDGTTNRMISTPVQIGQQTNWVKVRAGLLETVAFQSDGSLWYWGVSPNPSIAQETGQIVSPMRVSADTNWADVGFGVYTVFAIKSDGTLWTWGRNADRFTGATDPAQNTIPTRIGTNSDWRSICATTGWWCNGLIKKDGSLWFMDASEGRPNGPRNPYKPVEFRRIPFGKDYVAYAAGAIHAPAPGFHSPCGVILTGEGEVWTWGMVLGDPRSLRNQAELDVARLAQRLFPRRGITLPDPDPVYSSEPWQLPVDGQK